MPRNVIGMGMTEVLVSSLSSTMDNLRDTNEKVEAVLTRIVVLEHVCEELKQTCKKLGKSISELEMEAVSCKKLQCKPCKTKSESRKEVHRRYVEWMSKQVVSCCRKTNKAVVQQQEHPDSDCDEVDSLC